MKQARRLPSDGAGSAIAAGHHKRDRTRLILPVVFLGVGALFLFLAAAQLIATALFFAHTQPATATYVGSVAHSGGNHGGTFLYPRFRYRDAAGSARYVTSGAGSSAQTHATGDTVTVRYDAARSDRTIICSFWTLWAGPLFCGVFASAFGLPGLAILRMQRRSRVAADA